MKDLAKFRNFFSTVRIGDGGLATYLHSRGESLRQSFEALNLSEPEKVRDVHQEYLEAGADLIETNSFCANRHKLREYDLQDNLREILRNAVKSAQEAAKSQPREIIIAGSLGPLTKKRRELDDYSESEIEGIWDEAISVLVESGVDVLLFETFSRLSDLEVAVKIASNYDKPIIAQLAFSEQGVTDAGISMKRAFRVLEDLGVDMVGSNCRVGPGVITAMIDQMRHYTDLPLSVFPNSRYMQELSGRFLSQDLPSYFAKQFDAWVKAGAVLIGGCCGTTPEHIAALTKAKKAWSKKNPGFRYEVAGARARNIEVLEKTQGEIAINKFVADVVTKPAFVTVELEPPKNLQLRDSYETAHRLVQAGCDAINIPDNALARVHMNHVIFAELLRQQVDVPLILHLTCRDKNLLALQSDLLASHVVGIESILAITGDPASGAEGTDASSVYDVTSVGLVELIQGLNHGWSLGKSQTPIRTHFGIGVGANVNVAKREALKGTVHKLHKKKDAGANYICTQPVFDEDAIPYIVEDLTTVGLPIVLGIMPLVSARNAEFLHHEVPGIRIPDSVRKSFEGKDKEEAHAWGIHLAKRCIEKARAAGISQFYLIPPLGNIEIVEELITFIKSRQETY